MGVDPKELTNKHLIAEHREIKRIPNCVRRGRYNLSNQPTQFCLGQGHVKFFYDKLGYLLDRYNKLYRECIARGFQVQNYRGAWNGIDISLMGFYKETENDRKIVLERIQQKLDDKTP